MNPEDCFGNMRAEISMAFYGSVYQDFGRLLLCSAVTIVSRQLNDELGNTV